MMGPQPYTAAATYGTQPTMQPDATGVATHAPGTPEPTFLTVAPAGLLGSPVLALVVLIGLAALLVHVSVRVDLDA